MGKQGLVAIGTKHGAVKVLGREGVERLLRVEVHCAINTRRLYFNRSPVYLICVPHRAALARVPAVVSSVPAELIRFLVSCQVPAPVSCLAFAEGMGVLCAGSDAPAIYVWNLKVHPRDLTLLT
jgi:hypothetical protein